MGHPGRDARQVRIEVYRRRLQAPTRAARAELAGGVRAPAEGLPGNPQGAGVGHTCTE